MRRWGIAGGVGLALGLALYGLWGSRTTETQGCPQGSAAGTITTPADEVAVRDWRAAARFESRGRHHSQVVDERAAPHPITSEHLSIYRDVDLLDRAWQAALADDFAQAHRLLRDHRREYPGEDDMREGLSLLVDCREQRSATALVRARAFYDTQTHSMMRRRIRRYCLSS